MLFNLFKKKPEAIPADVSLLKTDMHSHLIPGIDDGTRNIEESVELIKKMRDLGYEKIITTPHIQNDYFKNNNEIINNGLNELKAALKEKSIDINIEAAAEYLIDDGFPRIMEKGELMTFGDKYVLVELSYYNFNSLFFEYVFQLNVAGYKVVLAHPERYAYFHDKIDVYEDLKARGVLFQLNIISLSGYYSDKVRKVAEKLVDLGLVDFAASDMHNFIYYENFLKALGSSHMHKLIESGKLKNIVL